MLGPTHRVGSVLPAVGKTGFPPAATIQAMKQHWVPRSYLAAWTDPGSGNVWALNKTERRIFNPSPRSIFAETHMYSITKEDGTRDIALEQRLARLEGEFVSVRDGLEQNVPLAPEDQGFLAVYAAVMHARSKFMRDHHRGQWQRTLDRMTEMDKAIQEGGAAAFRAFAGPSDERNVITREQLEHVVANTGAMILPPFAKAEAHVYARMNLAVLFASSRDTFITSDQPCTWLDNEPQNRGFWQRSPLMSKGLEVYLPISPRRCLVWSHTATLTGMIPIGDRHVKSMNLWLAAHAAILVRERPFFEKDFCENPVMVRAIGNLFPNA